MLFLEKRRRGTGSRVCFLILSNTFVHSCSSTPTRCFVRMIQLFFLQNIFVVTHQRSLRELTHFPQYLPPMFSSFSFQQHMFCHKTQWRNRETIVHYSYCIIAGIKFSSFGLFFSLVGLAPYMLVCDKTIPSVCLSLSINTLTFCNDILNHRKWKKAYLNAMLIDCINNRLFQDISLSNACACYDLSKILEAT